MSMIFRLLGRNSPNTTKNRAPLSRIVSVTIITATAKIATTAAIGIIALLFLVVVTTNNSAMGQTIPPPTTPPLHLTKNVNL